MIYAFISENLARFDLETMCRVLMVSRSGFYAWRARPKSQRAKEERRLTEKIETVHASSRGTYGSLRVHTCLLEQGEAVSRPRVARIMRQHGIRGRSRRRFKATTNSNHAHPVAANRLERDFSTEKPDQKWAADITYLPTSEGWLYLAVVLDLFSRRVVGWSMSASLETGFVLDALEMARTARRPEPGLVHHSDWGAQYAARDFQRALERLEAVLSMSRKGDCWDNAVVESFFGSLKLELDLDSAVGSRARTRAVVFEWIEVWYNRQRRHSSLGFMSPEVFEESWARTNRVSTKP